MAEAALSDEYGYTTATVILDPEAFALWLGIDFALTLNKEVDVSLSALDTITYALSRYHTNLWDGTGPIDTFTHVYHGPVQYEDRSGDIDAQEELFDPGGGQEHGSPRKPRSKSRTSTDSLCLPQANSFNRRAVLSSPRNYALRLQPCPLRIFARSIRGGLVGHSTRTPSR